MDPSAALRAVTHWGHFLSRTVGYGALSCTAGALWPGPGLSQACMRRWCVGVCDSLRIRRQVLGAEGLFDREPCVYVANHSSFLDVLVLGSLLECDYRWLAKADLFRLPFLGWHLRIAGHIPVARGEGADNSSLPRRVHAAVGQGASLLYFPEGRRSETGTLGPFRIGAFMTAVREDLPVIPLVVRGTADLMPRDHLDLVPDEDRACSVTVLPTQVADGPGDERDRAGALSRAVHGAMNAELARSRNPDPQELDP